MYATTPGLVCAHHHLYSSLARGMPAPPRTPTNFSEILELIWWRLDKALDLEMIRWSAMLGALEALLAGTTAIVDHHSSPNAIEGSLDVISNACAEVGVRVNCCYEITDRNGPAAKAAGLAENERFVKAGGVGMVGAHACFTLSQESLEEVAGLAKDLGCGVHIHVGEDRVDADAGERLEELAQPNWLLAHCVHLDRGLEGIIAHNPRSNQNNGVGYAHPTRFSNTVVLGTDGIGADMLEEFRIAYARLREDDVTATPSTPWQWLENGWKLMPEALSDQVLWSYAPMDPWHLAFTPGVRAVQVRVGGEIVLDNGRPTKVDEHEVRSKAAEQQRRLWAALSEQ
ncbi:MAG: amidohydrolase family protein [Actinobacteria bacterium]|jgi:cytosine/adenosine deaminase-related metal-dependent hydrolase|nr:amidohydrolase family protein [Actinomycetota bacterium]MCL6094504.1 amidohydrolase family protein [Actinomycetota bacterium]